MTSEQQKKGKVVFPTDWKSTQKSSCDEKGALEKWAQVEKGIDEIYRRSRSDYSFQSMFTNCFQLIKAGYGKLVYEKLQNCMKRRIEEQREKVLNANETTFLRVISEEWDVHTLTTCRTTDVLMHLDRQFCIQQNYKSITNLGLYLFGEVVLKHQTISERLRHNFLQIIDLERSGDVVPTSSNHLKLLSTMMITIDKRDIFGGFIEAHYLQRLEDHYSQEISAFASEAAIPQTMKKIFQCLHEERDRGVRYLDPSTVPKIEQIFRHAVIIPHLKTFLTKPGSGLQDLLRQWQVPEVHQMYLLFAFVTEIPQFIKNMCMFFLGEGMSIVNENDTQGGVNGSVIFVEKLIALKQKIDELLRVALRHMAPSHNPILGGSTPISIQRFNPDDPRAAQKHTNQAVSAVTVEVGSNATTASVVPGSGLGGIDRFAEAELLKTFEEVINKNPNCAENLSLFLDSRLKNPTTGASSTISGGAASNEDLEFEQACDNVMSLLKHLRDKDLFEHSYKLHLARRLLMSKPGASDEGERVFINKLKREFGVNATSRLEGMFTDKRLSVELNDNFKQRMEQKREMQLSFELYVTVLTSGFWPPNVAMTVSVPGEADRASAIFRSFYLSKYKGRCLNYQLCQGTFDLRMVTPQRKYDVNVSTSFCSTLLLFDTILGSNKEDVVYSIQEIANACRLSVSEACKVVASLSRNASTHNGLLKLENKSATSTTTIPSISSSSNVLTGHTLVRFNNEFKSRHIKVKIVPVSAIKGDKGGSGDGEKGGSNSSGANAGAAAKSKFDEDRKYKIDAAIVRIMKSRRTLEHRVLTQEVTNVLKNNFCPSADEVKRRIEHLIEREFIERSEESNSKYNYLA